MSRPPPWAAKVIRLEMAMAGWNESARERRWLHDLGWGVLASGVTLAAVIAVQQVVYIGMGR